jgi:hypothetical protein
MTKEYPYIEKISDELILIHINCDITIESNPQNDEKIKVIEHRLLSADTQTDFVFFRKGTLWISDKETEDYCDEVGTVSIKENGATLLSFQPVDDSIYLRTEYEHYVKCSKILKGYFAFKKFKKKVKLFNKCRMC